mmetsp:Transcript_55393/g.103965  ORF Transcript_55393/g.103965 Transcript_55393/m.103965 type:complete len:203 (+) Transcript_55393:255-863(+)
MAAHCNLHAVVAGPSKAALGCRYCCGSLRVPRVPHHGTGRSADRDCGSSDLARRALEVCPVLGLVALLEICILRGRRCVGNDVGRCALAASFPPSAAAEQDAGLFGHQPNQRYRPSLTRCRADYLCARSRRGPAHDWMPQRWTDFLHRSDPPCGRKGWLATASQHVAARPVHGRHGLLRMPRRVPLRRLEYSRHARRRSAGN